MWIVLALVVGNLVGVIVGALVPIRCARCTVPYVIIGSLGALGFAGWLGPWLGVVPQGWRDLVALAWLGAMVPVAALHAVATVVPRGRRPVQAQGAG